MKTVLVVGASGFLGQNLVKYLDNKGYGIIATAGKTERIPKGTNVKIMSLDDFFASRDVSADTVINCAFSRGNNSKDLVSALDFNEKLIAKLKTIHTGSILNISSQGIYRNINPGEYLREDGEIEPKEMYALAKYAQERLFTSNLEGKVTNIRLASLSENAGFLVFFAKSVMTGKDITVTAPGQYVSIIEVSDAVRGIERIMELDKERRASVYNLGSEKQYSILEMAELTNEIGSKMGYKKVSIRIEDSGKKSAIGMDCTCLRKDTGWECRISAEDMIKAIFKKGAESE